ncbi:MAG: gliding motility-associated C-terminal domain-containing protein, partial [Bacteroidia bacterium]|nr:gliding motility-associated C-terminal domain-containing protein [Bacteroidia bacterium]MBP6658822.1 gliding motility-associated C-terminal domain-containing protein [Bacteroidia bacterium]
DSLIVEEDCLSDILFPNAFTPNEDGINEIFSGVGSEPENFKLRIFDRWGELIFESNSILNGWDGKYNGHSVHDGVYVYQSIFTIAKNNEIEKTGKVVLIR